MTKIYQWQKTRMFPKKLTGDQIKCLVSSWSKFRFLLQPSYDSGISVEETRLRWEKSQMRDKSKLTVELNDTCGGPGEGPSQDIPSWEVDSVCDWDKVHGVARSRDKSLDSQQVCKSKRLQWLLETSTMLKGDSGEESCEQQGCKNMNTGVTNVL